jgi:hypothetical protein
MPGLRAAGSLEPASEPVHTIFRPSQFVGSRDVSIEPVLRNQASEPACRRRARGVDQDARPMSTDEYA